MAAAVVTQLDLVCLFGGVITGNEGISLATPPNPRGILATLLAQASSSVLVAVAKANAAARARPSPSWPTAWASSQAQLCLAGRLTYQSGQVGRSGELFYTLPSDVTYA
jgi:hypothetical protein